MFIIYLFLFLIGIGVFTSYNRKRKIKEINGHGIKAIGVIISNGDIASSGDIHNQSLGSHLYNPTIEFVTEVGEKIVGKPVVGFTSQNELIIPCRVTIVYNPDNPQEFYLDNGVE